MASYTSMASPVPPNSRMPACTSSFIVALPFFHLAFSRTAQRLIQRDGRHVTSGRARRLALRDEVLHEANAQHAARDQHDEVLLPDVIRLHRIRDPHRMNAVCEFLLP